MEALNLLSDVLLIDLRQRYAPSVHVLPHLAGLPRRPALGSFLANQHRKILCTSSILTHLVYQLLILWLTDSDHLVQYAVAANRASPVC